MCSLIAACLQNMLDFSFPDIFLSYVQLKFEYFSKTLKVQLEAIEM